MVFGPSSGRHSLWRTQADLALTPLAGPGTVELGVHGRLTDSEFTGHLLDLLSSQHPPRCLGPHLVPVPEHRFPSSRWGQAPTLVGQFLGYRSIAAIATATDAR